MGVEAKGPRIERGTLLVSLVDEEKCVEVEFSAAILFHSRLILIISNTNHGNDFIFQLADVTGKLAINSNYN